MTFSDPGSPGRQNEGAGNKQMSLGENSKSFSPHSELPRSRCHRKADVTMACCLLREMPIPVLLAAFPPFPKVVDIGITLKNQNQTNTTKQKLYRGTKVEQHGNICGLRVAHDSNLPRTALFP